MTPLANCSPSIQAGEASIPDLVAQVYAAAPAAERGHLLEQLLRPLGALSLVAIADGIFAKLRFRSGWQDLVVRLEDIQTVRTDQVVALVDHAQQVNIETVDGLAQWLAATPVLASSAAAALLITLLLQRARQRHGETASSLAAAPAEAAQHD